MLRHSYTVPRPIHPGEMPPHNGLHSSSGSGQKRPSGPSARLGGGLHPAVTGSRCTHGSGVGCNQFLNKVASNPTLCRPECALTGLVHTPAGRRGPKRRVTLNLYEPAGLPTRGSTLRDGGTCDDQATAIIARGTNSTGRMPPARMVRRPLSDSQRGHRETEVESASCNLVGSSERRQ